MVLRFSCRLVVFACVPLVLGAGCKERTVGETPDAAVDSPDASTGPCSPEQGGLGCVEIVFPLQQAAFTAAEAAAGIDFVWELVVPDPLAEVYPHNQDPGCCVGGVGPLKARETVGGNNQYYCDCDHGLCDPSGCDDPLPMELPAGTTTQTFVWPGVNWYGPSDTGNPYGYPFPRGEYEVRVQATGQWRPSPGGDLATYTVEGTMAFEIIDGCGDRPAVEAAMWSCTGGVGEGGLCLDLTVDAAGEPVSWLPESPLDPTVDACLDDAIMTDCYPSLVGTTETICIYGV
ncbi:MAG: hypothetical protein ABI333_05740 [bacterium]